MLFRELFDKVYSSPHLGYICLEVYFELVVLRKVKDLKTIRYMTGGSGLYHITDTGYQAHHYRSKSEQCLV